MAERRHQYPKAKRRDLSRVQRAINLAVKAENADEVRRALNSREAPKLTIDEVLPIVLNRKDLRVVTRPGEEDCSPYQAKVEINLMGLQYQIQLIAVDSVGEAVRLRDSDQHDPLHIVVLAATNTRTVRYEFVRQVQLIGDRLSEQS